nr:capsid protein [Sarcosphaera coronaria partitivirus]
MGKGKETKKFSKPRNYDRESGKNRVQPPKYSVNTESDSEGSQTDTSVEEFMEKKAKDDSRRKQPAKKPKNKRDKNVRPTDDAEEADDEDVEVITRHQATTASHAEFMAALAYRTGFTKRAFMIESTYIPDVSAMFTILRKMAQTITENSYIHEVYPAYHSLALYMYYGHVTFYHILRARSDAKLLTRVERRCLRTYEEIGPPEAWPIATPMIGFVQSLGRITPEGGKYGQIVPALPAYSNFSHTTERGLTRLSHIHGIARLPIIPAMHAFLYNYGQGTATYVNSQLYPTTAATLSGTVTFMGLTDSQATAAPFQTLAYSAAWNAPCETGVETYTAINEQKRALITRWRIPEFAATTNITDLDIFLGIEDGKRTTWIKELLKLSTAVNKFFPGSVNLNSIPPITRAETVSKITGKVRTTPTATTDEWYNTKDGWKLDLEGVMIRDDSQIAYQTALSQRTRLYYDASTHPAVVPAATLQSGENGDYFNANGPQIEIDCVGQPDPMEQADALIESKLYDKTGGRQN